MTVHAFVDESARGHIYLIAAAVVEPAHVRQLRREMCRLLLPGQRELHFKKEKPARRRQLADAIARLPVEVQVYSHLASVRRTRSATVLGAPSWRPA